jgi:hypothetical protein
MGGYSEGIEASGSSGSRKAHPVSISPQEDRCGTKVAMVEGAGGRAEEGGLKSAEPAAKLRQALSIRANPSRY